MTREKTETLAHWEGRLDLRVMDLDRLRPSGKEGAVATE